MKEVNFRGYAPLLDASYNRHEGVAKLLPGREEVSPDKPDNESRVHLLTCILPGKVMGWW